MAGTMLGSLTHYISLYPYAYCNLKIMPEVITACLESDNECWGEGPALQVPPGEDNEGGQQQDTRCLGWEDGLHPIRQEKSTQRRNPNHRFDLLHNYFLSQLVIILHLRLGGVLLNEGKKQSGFPEPCPGSWRGSSRRHLLVESSRPISLCQWLLAPLSDYGFIEL